MFQIKQSTPDINLRTVLVYLVQDDDGKTPVTGWVPATGEISIVKSDETLITPTDAEIAGNWQEVGTSSVAPGTYLWTFAVTWIDSLGALTLSIAPAAADNVRIFNKECVVVAEPSTSGLYAVEKNGQAEIICYLTDAATDLIPQLALDEANTPTLTLITPTGVVAANTANWVQMAGADGLYRWKSTAAETETPGYLALVVEKSTPTAIRTFVKDFQVIDAEAPEVPTVTDRKYRIPIVPGAFLRQAHTVEPKSGTPKYASVWPKRKRDELDDGIEPDVVVAGQDPGQSRQRFEIQFYPTPDVDYVLEYRYERRPGRLDLTMPFPEGAGVLAEVFLASALSIAEQRVEKAAGVETERYLALLEQAKARDDDAELPTAGSIWPHDLEGFDKHATDAGVRTPGSSSAPGFNFRTLRRDVADELGITTAPQSWTHLEDRKVDRCIQSGYRKLLMPRLIEGLKRKIHTWSFLSPKATLLVGAADSGKPDQLPGSENLYYPPLNFRDLIGDMYLESPVTGRNTIKRINTQKMQDLLTAQTASHVSNRPQAVALRPILTDTLTYDENGVPTQTQTSRYVFEFFPTPDTDYTVTYLYSVDPFPLTNDNVVPFGSPIHSETLRALCLAEAEVELHRKRGVRFEEAMECLEKSILHDSRIVSGGYHGYCGDNSDTVHSDPHGHHYHAGSVTYEGVQY